MHDVKGVLDFLDYDQLRPAGGEWQPLSEVNGQYGTTDETHLIRHRQEDGVMRLVDAETGEQVATARKNESNR